MEKQVRESVIAGSWYPGGRDLLEGMLDDFLDNVEAGDAKDLRALICPHAGYLYSGQVAAYGYKHIAGRGFNKVIIMAPSHHHPFYGISVPNYTHYKTPLGEVPVSPETGELLDESDLIQSIDEAHSNEHSAEIQLPFLQITLKNFTIIPMVFGQISMRDISEVVGIILKHVDEDTLIVVSSDLSHYHSYSDAVAMDEGCINAILSLDTKKASDEEMCGKYPMLALMEMAGKMNWSGTLLKYANSGDVTGDKTGGVVGYASIVFHGEFHSTHRGRNEELGNKQQRYLLEIARKAIETYLSGGRVIDVGAGFDELKESAGTFVTLEKHGDLRGCIGNILPEGPIYLGVRDNAINAGFKDPRFKPLGVDELSEIEIEVSILSLPELIDADNPEKYLEEIESGMDGIIIKQRGRSATYLPQVWEKIPDKKLFLENLCQKAYLSRDCWRNSDVEIYRYRVQAFREGGK